MDLYITEYFANKYITLNVINSVHCTLYTYPVQCTRIHTT